MLVVRDVPNHYHNGDGRARRCADRVLPAREGEIVCCRILDSSLTYAAETTKLR